MFRCVSHVPSPTYIVFDEYVLLPAGVSPVAITEKSSPRVFLTRGFKSEFCLILLGRYSDLQSLEMPHATAHSSARYERRWNRLVTCPLVVTRRSSLVAYCILLDPNSKLFVVQGEPASCVRQHWSSSQISIMIAFVPGIFVHKIPIS